MTADRKAIRPSFATVTDRRYRSNILPFVMSHHSV
jgi:hypothetical protein